MQFAPSRDTVFIRCWAAFLLGSVAFLQSCGGGTSGSGGSPPPPASNPVPVITLLAPNSATAGGTAFTLTVTGQNFVSGATVQWNGTARPTTFSSSTRLQAQISAADLVNAGLATVSVTNPTPGGGNSGLAQFQILQVNGTNPAPALSYLSPSVIDAGSSGFLLTVGGTNFLPASTILWNGSVLPTTYLSNTRLEAQIPAGDVAVAGFAAVSVLNPSPGGGTSTPLSFSINYLPTVLNQSANDLVWDNTHQLIYLSVPSLAASNGNTVAALDPVTGNISSTHFAGSEPDRVAISANDQYLYAGLDGSSSVQRFTLPGLLPDISYSLGAISFFGPTFAWDLQVAPGLPQTTAVSRGVFSTFPYSALAGVEIHDDASLRPTIASSPGNLYDSLQWGSDTTIYASNGESSNFDFYVLDVVAGGVSLSNDYQNVFSSFYTSIHFDSGTGLVYDDDGTVVNPANGKVVGVFPASGSMVPDSATNAAYFLGQTAFQFGTTSATIVAFDLTTFAPVAEIPIPNVQGNPLHLIRWGANGLAFNDDAGHIYLVNNSSVVAAANARPVKPDYVAAVHKTRSFPKVIRASNAKFSAKAALNNAMHTQAAYSTVPNPAPGISALSPNTVAAGAVSLNGLTLTVFGSNFVSLSTVEWGGSPRPTQFVSTTELQAQITFSDVLNAGSIPVTVNTPAPGGGTSNTLPFAILSSASNQAPILTSLYPNAVSAGSAGFTLSINGYAYFTPSTIVEWNGNPRPATLYSPGQLQIQVNPSDVAAPGFAQITVINPGPEGGSATADFQVLYQPTIMNQVTNDIVWDALNQVIYFSVPGSASTHANQVCALNPATATIVNCQNAGSEPDLLAISDNSQFLYVGEDGSNTVQRFGLPALTPDISYSLAPYFALDLQVAPGAPHTVAVSEGGPFDPACVGGISIFDDSTPRSTSATGWGPTTNCYDSLQWGANASTLYAACSENSTMDFYTLNVSSSGVTLNQDYQGVFWNPGRIHYDRGSGLVYSDDGFHAIDPSTGLPAGIFEVGGGWPMAPDSSLGHNFMLDQYIFQGGGNYTITIFDMTHYVPVSRIPFSTGSNGINRLGRFIRWGTNGLAVSDKQGNLYLISGSFVN